MATEIERKFLVKGDEWRKLGQGTVFRQGFLSTVKERVVRVRVAGEKGSMTVKGVNKGIERVEYDYEIPLADAEAMLDGLCEQPIIEKTRYKIEYGSHIWEVDEFEGENSGLVIAEVELGSADEEFEKPDWVGDDVSDDHRYFNSNLIKNPYSKW